MTILYAQSTGNASEIAWNTVANGSGDSVPWGDQLETDTIEGNAFTVTLDVASFIRALLATANGGGFSVNLAAVGNRTFTCSGTAGITNCLSTSGATYTLALVGDWTGSPSTTSKVGVLNGSGATITIDGDCIGGGVASTHGYYQAYSGTGGGATILGECRPGASSSACGAMNESNAPMTIYDAVGHATYAAGSAVSAYRTGGRSAVIIARGNLDWTKASAPINVPFRYEPDTGKGIRVLAADGITARWYFLPSAPVVGGLVARRF